MGTGDVAWETGVAACKSLGATDLHYHENLNVACEHCVVKFDECRGTFVCSFHFFFFLTSEINMEK